MSLTKVRNYAINDFITWYEADSLQISPKYQRNNNLWNHNQKSYFIDSILRDFPIPPIFMREYIDFEKGKKTIREIIDGQQRLRAIISFKANEYPIMAEHNEEYANMYYEDLPEDIKYEFLYKELLVQQVITSDDSKIYEIFVRYNSNSTPLNAQELRNAKYWGSFKIIVNAFSNSYRSFFIKKHLFSDAEIARMADIEFVSVLAILVVDGIVPFSETTIDKYYSRYDTNWKKYEVEKFLDLINRPAVIVNNAVDNLATKSFIKQFYYYLFAALYTIFSSQYSNKTALTLHLGDFIIHNINSIYNFCVQENLLPTEFTYQLDKQIVDKLANYIQTQALNTEYAK